MLYECIFLVYVSDQGLIAQIFAFFDQNNLPQRDKFTQLLLSPAVLAS